MAPRQPLHVVLRSTRARGSLSMLSPRRARAIEGLARGLARDQGVRLYRYANAGNHLHLVVLPGSRPALRAYLRSLAGLIARLVLDVQRGRPGDGAKFWDARPFTRIVEWGRDFRRACAYTAVNELEATGFIPPRAKPRARAGPLLS